MIKVYAICGGGVKLKLSYTMGGITKSSTFCIACLDLECLG